MFRTFTTATAALLMSAAMAVAQPIGFVPEGSADTLRMVDATTGKTIKRISGLEAVHGLSGALGVPYLVAGSYAETDRAAIAELAQPQGVSEDEHARIMQNPKKS